MGRTKNYHDIVSEYLDLDRKNDVDISSPDRERKGENLELTPLTMYDLNFPAPAINAMLIERKEEFWRRVTIVIISMERWAKLDRHFEEIQLC